MTSPYPPLPPTNTNPAPAPFTSDNITKPRYTPGGDATGDTTGFDVQLFDDAKHLINTPSASIATVKPPEGSKARGVVNFDSDLPLVLVVSVYGDDDDWLGFGYGDQAWRSDDEDKCKFGGYNSMWREGDCSFECK